MYKIYHIPEIKIGVSIDPKQRVQDQGYTNYEILEEHTCVDEASKREKELQKQYGYKVDKLLYSQTLKNITHQGRSKGGKNGKPSNQRTRRIFTFDQAEEIRQLYKLPQWSLRSLGKKYNTSRKCISNIIHNKTYLEP